MTKTEPAAPSVEEALAEAEEAQALVVALEDRIRSGDGSVTPADLTKAKELAEFGRLQVDAARLRVEQANRESAIRYIEQTCQAAHTLAAAGPAAVEKLRKAASKAFLAYVEELDRLAARAGVVMTQVESANLQAASHGLDGTTEHGVRQWTGRLEVWHDGATVEIPSGQPDPSSVVADVVASAGYQVPALYTRPVTSTRPWPPQEVG